MKNRNKKIPHCRNSSKITSKKHKFCKTDTPNTNDHSLLWLDTETSIESDGVKLVYVICILLLDETV